MDNKLKIINHLAKNHSREFTMHELSSILKIPYATFHRTVAQIEDLLIIKSIGKSKVLSLNKSNGILKSYLAISSEEKKKEFLENSPIIRKISQETASDSIFLLFGSYAKGQQTKDSDIDLMIINKDGKKEASFSKYELLFRKRINPMFFTKNEFKAMLKDKEQNVAKQALENHIVLANPEMFWEAVLDGIRQRAV